MKVSCIATAMAACFLCVAQPFPTCAKETQSPTMAEIERASGLVDVSPEKALTFADSIRRHMSPNDAEQAALLMVEGNAFFSQGKTAEGISRLRAAVASSRSAKDHTLEANALGDLGVMLRVAQKPDSALACYNEALAIMNRYGAEPADEAGILISVAILYTNSGRVSDAVPFARRAVERIADSDDIETSMYVGSQAGLILFKAGLRQEGIDIEKRIVAQAERRAIPRYILKSYASIIDMYHQTGSRDSVALYLDKGERLLGSVPEGSVESLGFLEESYKVLADMGLYRQSLDIQKRILAMKDAGTFMPLDRLWQRVARNYAALGEFRLMGEAYERSIAISDSLRNSDIDRQLSEFNVKYESLQKDLTISRLEAQRTRERMWLTVWIAIATVAAVVWVMVKRRREAMERIRANLQGIEQERARLARELHDGICNDLYAINLLLRSRTPDISEIAGDLDRIRNDVRHISHELMPPRFGETDLDELFRVYVARTPGFFSYSSEGKPDLSEGTAYQLYRIVQELCSNIMTHSGAESACIAASYTHGHTAITISYRPADSVVHYSAGDGIGLDTIRRRAELIHAEISTHAESGVTTVNVSLHH